MTGCRQRSAVGNRSTSCCECRLVRLTQSKPCEEHSLRKGRGSSTMIGFPRVGAGEASYKGYPSAQDSPGSCCSNGLSHLDQWAGIECLRELAGNHNSIMLCRRIESFSPCGDEFALMRRKQAKYGPCHLDQRVGFRVVQTFPQHSQYPHAGRRATGAAASFLQAPQNVRSSR